MDCINQPSRKILFGALTVSVLSISSAATMIRVADAPALVVASARMLFASAFLWMLSPWTGAHRIKEVNWKAVGLAGFFLALHFGFWISSLDSTSVASSLVLVTMNPVVVALASTLLLKDPPSKPLVTGTVLSMIGCFILVIGEGFSISSSLKGNFLALGGAVAMSFYIIIGRYSSGLNKDRNVLSYLTWVSTIAGLLLLTATITAGIPIWGYSRQSTLLMILIALIPQLLGHSLINWALKHLHPSYLAAAILGEPLSGTLIAFLVINETFSVYSLSGGVFILIGVAMAFRRTTISSG